MSAGGGPESFGTTRESATLCPSLLGGYRQHAGFLPSSATIDDRTGRVFSG